MTLSDHLQVSPNGKSLGTSNEVVTTFIKDPSIVKISLMFEALFIH